MILPLIYETPYGICKPSKYSLLRYNFNVTVVLLCVNSFFSLLLLFFCMRLHCIFSLSLNCFAVISNNGIFILSSSCTFFILVVFVSLFLELDCFICFYRFLNVFDAILWPFDLKWHFLTLDSE